MTSADLETALRWSDDERARFRQRFSRLHADVVRNSAWEASGVNCGPGWKTLLERVFALAERDFIVRVVSVESRAGALCIEIENVVEISFLSLMIKKVRTESLRVCEACGVVGNTFILDDDDVRTLCADHVPLGAELSFLM